MNGSRVPFIAVLMVWTMFIAYSWLSIIAIAFLLRVLYIPLFAATGVLGVGGAALSTLACARKTGQHPLCAIIEDVGEVLLRGMIVGGVVLFVGGGIAVSFQGTGRLLDLVVVSTWVSWSVVSLLYAFRRAPTASAAPDRSRLSKILILTGISLGLVALTRILLDNSAPFPLITEAVAGMAFLAIGIALRRRM